MEEKTAVISSELFELADSLKEKKSLKKELEEQTKAVNKEIEELDQRLSDAMAEAECPNFSHSGSTFYLNTRLYASPKAGLKEDMIAALRAHGFGDLVSETVNANTLASFCKEQIAESGEAEALPEWLSDVVNTFDKVTVGIRKG